MLFISLNPVVCDRSIMVDYLHKLRADLSQCFLICTMELLEIKHSLKDDFLYNIQ